MSAVAADAESAGRLVEARLGREPQDMLEAAVVLEAWGGIPAERALHTAQALMPRSPSSPQSSRATLPRVERGRGLVLEGAAFVLTVIAAAFWAAPLAAAVGNAAVGRALTLALPLTLGLQWGLRSRYLGRPGGLVTLARRRELLVVGACALVALPTAALGVSGLAAGLLSVIWTGGTLLIRRRWSAAYLGIVLAGTVLISFTAPLAVLGGIAAVTALTVGFALGGPRASTPGATGRLSRAVCSAALGVGLGALLVGDPSVTWTEGTVPALALLPSTVAGFWGGYHLWKLEQVISGAVVGRSAAGDRTAGSAPLRTLFGSVGRLAGLAAALSAASRLFTAWLGGTPSPTGLLVGFGLLALASLLVSLLEALGRGSWAVLAVIAALTADALVRLSTASVFAGTGLVVGAGLVVIVLLPAAVVLLRHPARTLATALWVT